MQINSLSEESTIEKCPVNKNENPTSKDLLSELNKIKAAIPRESYKIVPSSNPNYSKDIHSCLNNKIAQDIPLIRARHNQKLVEKVFDGAALDMYGVSILASYLQRKKGVKGLYVCSSLEVFQERLEQISEMEGNGRFGLILPSGPDKSTDDRDRLYGANPAHKIAICIEKKDGHLHIALLDSLGIEPNEVRPCKILSTNRKDLRKIKGLDALIWYIYHSKLKPENFTIYLSSIERQVTGYACETFALRDAVEFLQDHQFFERIESRDVNVFQKGQMLKFKKIISLSPALMKGSQDIQQLEHFVKLNTSMPEKKQSVDALSQSMAKHVITIYDNIRQNHYINERSYKYHLLVLKILETMETQDIEKMTLETLLTKARPFWDEKFIPQTPSDAYRWYRSSYQYTD